MSAIRMRAVRALHRQRALRESGRERLGSDTRVWRLSGCMVPTRSLRNLTVHVHADVERVTCTSNPSLAHSNPKRTPDVISLRLLHAEASRPRAGHEPRVGA